MRLIDAETVHRLLDYAYLVDALEAAHHHDTQASGDLLLEQPGGLGMASHFFVRAAWQQGRSVGAKVITIFPDNNRNGCAHPAIQAVYVLFDGDTGAPLACIDGTALTLRKTAGDSALGAKHLARDDVEHLLMVGAGAMAPHLIRAHCAVRPSLRHVSIWNRAADRAAALAAELQLDGVALHPSTDLERSAREADLICSATASSEPLLRGEWLTSGVHVDLVGAFTETMREADNDVFRRGRVYVDSRASTVAEIGELIIPIRDGVLGEADVLADLYELCRGLQAGRTDPEAITVFKNGGGGHLDLMTARLVYDRVVDEAPDQVT